MSSEPSRLFDSRENSIEVYYDDQMHTVQIDFHFAVRGVVLNPAAARVLAQMILDAAAGAAGD